MVLNFYADWCPFSARWKPVFQETAKQIYNETSQNSNTDEIIFGQINCEVETQIAQRFRITKFPTTKLTIAGKANKKEYRGARTSEAFKEYIKKFLSDPIIYVNNEAQLNDKIGESKGAVLIYSTHKDEHLSTSSQSRELIVFRRVAQQLREECQFFHVSGALAVSKVSNSETHSVEFKPQQMKLSTDNTIRYPMNMVDLDQLTRWSKDHCVPIVREITFENAEEMTEEGLPFVILFFHPNDKSHIEIYKKVVQDELRSEVSSVTFLYADGVVFSHPLKHLGRTTQDLPLLAIDSFKHLFLYKEHISTISNPGKLKQFIQDLHTGKLDREFHFGPDPTPKTVSLLEDITISTSGLFALLES